MISKRSVSPLIGLLTVFILSVLALGSPAPTFAQSAQDTAPHELTAEDVAPFIDGLVAAQMASLHVPGVEVAVVKDGEVIYLHGYGYADVEDKTPVDPETTLFRPGSVTKLLVWTAVMQLVEQGKLDLDADINTYLDDVQIPEAYGKPITMLNLMSHTPGFEDQGTNLFVGAPEEMHPLGEYLNTNMVARVYPPGDTSAYSNYGVTLAGYIIQKVSGEDFYDYMDNHVLGPLGMDHSTLRQPLPADLESLMSTGYIYNGAYQAADFEFVQAAPAGSLSATASDMAKFMIAHLEGGSYDGNQVLKPETLDLMHTQHYTADPSIPGWAHGFMEEEANGLRILHHGGDTILFHSGLYLIPEEHVGVYVTYNSTSGAPGRGAFIKAFLDRYYPVEAPAAPEPPADFSSRIQDYTGFYGLSRANYTTAEKISGLAQQIPVQPGADGKTLTIASVEEQGVMDTFVEVRPGLIQNTRNGSLMLFTRQGDSGPYDRVHPTTIQGFVGLRSTWVEAPPFNLTILISGILLALTAVLAAPAGLLGPRRKAPDTETNPWPRRAARWTGFAWGLCTLIYAAAITIMALNAQTDIAAFNAGPGPLYNVIWLTPLLALAMVVFSVLAWRGKFWSLAGRIHYSLITLAALAMIWFDVFWKLISV
jgi:CubicO group peptidase (beta-lactamase class C family)